MFYIATVLELTPCVFFKWEVCVCRYAIIRLSYGTYQIHKTFKSDHVRGCFCKLHLVGF